MNLNQDDLLVLMVFGLLQPTVGASKLDMQSTGAFSITMTTEELLGQASEKTQSLIASDEQIVWQIYIPKSYSNDSPAGVVVYVSPSSSGAIPRGWASVLDSHNLIWISANQSGNRVLAPRRVLKAILGLEVVRQRYTIDEGRIYIAGFSGGGKVASMIATDFATTFDGGIFICGVEFWQQDEPPHIEAIRSNRYVFLTGERDQSLESTKRVYRNPPRDQFNKAIEFLEAESNRLH